MAGCVSIRRVSIMPSAKLKCELGYIMRYETENAGRNLHIRRYLVSLSANVSRI